MKKLLFVFPIVALLAAGCNSSQQADNQPPIVKNTSPTPTPTAITPTTSTSTAMANWNIYNDANYHFSFKHPSTVPVISSSRGDFYIYEILIRIIQDPNASDGLIVIPANKVVNNNPNDAAFSVSSLDDLANHFESYKRGAVTYTDTVTHFTTASSEPGIKVVETMSTSSTATPTIDFVGYYFYHNGNVFLFRTFGQNMQFEEIVQTFQFTN